MVIRTFYSYRNHGRRERVEFSADDQSPEAVSAMFEALKAEHVKRRKAAAAKVVRQSFRKKKGDKVG
jgi:hypothetical protein